MPAERHVNLLDYHKKEFDIVTGNYKENNEERQAKERQEEQMKTLDRYWKTHNYDTVVGKFYDPRKE